MRRREVARREHGESADNDAHSGFSAVCGSGVFSVWVSGSASAEGPTPLHSVDIFLIYGGGNWNWLGDVPFFAVK